LARSPDAAGSPLSDPLKLLASMLRGQDWVKIDTLQCIDTASVPVIKFHTAEHSIHVDISFHANVTNHSGAEARELLKYYCGMYKELKPLALVLKQFLHLRKLNNSYTGGLSSYCLVLMIVSFLQLYGSRAPAAADGSSKNLGALLLDFLELYGLKFEYEKLAISIAIGGGHIPIEHCQPMVSAPLIILDPFNPQNNIGFNSFEMWKVRRAFSFAYNSATLQINSLIQSLNQEDREDVAIVVEQPKNFKVT
jgi:non-canonical poly(A) RNA polymerase PAPD5/7